MKTLRDKRALVTGAASGLGRAIALRLANEGTHVYLLDIDLEGASRVADEIRALGVEAMAARCDVSDHDQIIAACDKMLAEFGEIDVLVNNAGVGYYGPTALMTRQQWDWLMSINLMAPIRFTAKLLPILLERPEAHVLNMASICGLIAGGRFNAYHTSKFGLVGFSEALRAEYGRGGLGVTAICPGNVITNLYKSAPCGKEGKATPTPPRFLCTTEERVAKRAIRAIYRDERLPLVGYVAHLLHWMKRLTPWLPDMIQRIGRRKKLRQRAARYAEKQAAIAAAAFAKTEPGRRVA